MSMIQFETLLQTLTADQQANALHVWSASCEGVDALLSHADASELQGFGLIEGLTEPAKRGRGAGAYEFEPTDKLKDLVRFMRLREKMRRDFEQCGVEGHATKLVSESWKGA